MVVYICICIKILMILLCLINFVFFFKLIICSNFVLLNNYEIMVVIMIFN